MSDQNFFNPDEVMKEKELEKEILEALPEIPPEKILKKVIPCRRAMNFIITGLAFSTFTINLYFLNYFFSVAGSILLLIGLRTLKNENTWFKYSWIVSIVQNIAEIFLLGVFSTVHGAEFSDSLFGRTFCFINYYVLFVVLLIFFALGLKTLQEKAGIKAKVSSMIALIIWYLSIMVLGVTGATITIIGFSILVIVYILIIRSLCKIAKALYASGYAIKTKPVKISDKWLVAILTAAIAVSVSCGFIFFRSFPMDWTPVPENEHSEVEDIKAHLLELGFPENVLDDLSEEDIKACDGAVALVSESEEMPINRGHEVVETKKEGNTLYINRDTVYDVKELVITHVLVRLPGDTVRWKAFHHLYWKVDPGFLGTEALQVWYPGHSGISENAFSLTSDFTGRVMYDEGGRTYAAEYYEVSKKETATFFGMSLDTYLDFSMPSDGENKRCYVSYEFNQLNTGCLISPWVNYHHQMSLLQYPVYTASDYCAAGKNGYVFSEAQSSMTLTYDDVMFPDAEPDN